LYGAHRGAGSIGVREFGLDALDVVAHGLWTDPEFAGDPFVGQPLVREHGRCGGFPIDSVAEVRAIIDPATAEPVR
jgi:hypothetical protein